jgi:hypothetical protein
MSTQVQEAPVVDRPLGVASLVIALARCMLVLDGTIMIVALPSIQTAFYGHRLLVWTG